MNEKLANKTQSSNRAPSPEQLKHASYVAAMVKAAQDDAEHPAWAMIEEWWHRAYGGGRAKRANRRDRARAALDDAKRPRPKTKPKNMLTKAELTKAGLTKAKLAQLLDKQWRHSQFNMLRYCLCDTDLAFVGLDDAYLRRVVDRMTTGKPRKGHPGSLATLARLTLRCGALGATRVEGEPAQKTVDDEARRLSASRY